MKPEWSAGRFAAALAASAALVFAGCGEEYEGPERAEVFGTATWNGKEIDGGTINFFPADGGTGRTASATIEGGKYRIEEPMGPEFGEYKVLVNWSTPPTGWNPENLDAPLTEQIPPEYNTDTTLKATISESPQEISFALPQ